NAPRTKWGRKAGRRKRPAVAKVEIAWCSARSIHRPAGTVRPSSPPPVRSGAPGVVSQKRRFVARSQAFPSACRRGARLASTIPYTRPIPVSIPPGSPPRGGRSVSHLPRAAVLLVMLGGVGSAAAPRRAPQDAGAQWDKVFSSKDAHWKTDANAFLGW